MGKIQNRNRYIRNAVEHVNQETHLRLVKYATNVTRKVTWRLTAIQKLYIRKSEAVLSGDTKGFLRFGKQYFRFN